MCFGRGNVGSEVGGVGSCMSVRELNYTFLVSGPCFGGEDGGIKKGKVGSGTF